MGGGHEFPAKCVDAAAQVEQEGSQRRRGVAHEYEKFRALLAFRGGSGR